MRSNILDAERNLFNAELEVTKTQLEFFQSLINLYKAMGGGWEVTANVNKNK